MQRIAFRIPADTREDVLDGILPLLPSGIVERPIDDDTVEISSVAAVLPGDDALIAASPVPLDASRREDVPADWRERRRRFGGGAVLISDRLVVRSPWDPPAPEGMLEVVVERGGSGFGSGSHPTTQMSLGLLLDIEPGGGATDFGCGVGTLAIAAAKLGWSPCPAWIGRGPRSRSRAENAQRNGVEAEFALADVATAELPIRELLMANAPPPVHERVAGGGHPQVQHVIVSGSSRARCEPSQATYAAVGLFPQQGMAADTWIAMRLGREDG